jgi:hypothetical protein
MISQWVINAEMMHLLGKKVRISIKHNQKVGSGQTFKLGLLQLNASGTVDTSPAFLIGCMVNDNGRRSGMGNESGGDRSGRFADG